MHHIFFFFTETISDIQASWIPVFIYFQSNQRLCSSQSSLPPSTPVVSITTSNLTHPSLIYSGVSAAYNNGTLWSLIFVLCCVCFKEALSAVLMLLSLSDRLLPAQCRAIRLQYSCGPFSGLHGSMAAAPVELTGVRVPDCLLSLSSWIYSCFRNFVYPF